MRGSALGSVAYRVRRAQCPVGIRASITLQQTQSSHQPPSTLTVLSFRAPAPDGRFAPPLLRLSCLPPLHVPPLPRRSFPSTNWTPPPEGMPAASRVVLWSRYNVAVQLAQTPPANGRVKPSGKCSVSFWSALLRSRLPSGPAVIVVRGGPSGCPGAAQYATPRALKVGGTSLPDLACVVRVWTPPPAARGTLATVLSVSPPPSLALNAVTIDLALPLPSDTSLHSTIPPHAPPPGHRHPFEHRSLPHIERGTCSRRRIASGRPVSIRLRLPALILLLRDTWRP